MSNAGTNVNDRFACIERCINYAADLHDARNDGSVDGARALLRELRENAVPPAPAPCPEGWQPTHRHYKGGEYQFIGFGVTEADRASIAVYRGDNGTIYTRPAHEWHEKFVPLTAAPSAQGEEGKESVTSPEPHMSIDQALLYDALTEILDRVEACGASDKLTHAVCLIGDLRQAVGNQWNPADSYALNRVQLSLLRTKGDSP